MEDGHPSYWEGQPCLPPIPSPALPSPLGSAMFPSTGSCLALTMVRALGRVLLATHGIWPLCMQLARWWGILRQADLEPGAYQAQAVDHGDILSLPGSVL